MFKFIAKALAGLVLTKKARQAVGRRARVGQAAAKGGAGAARREARAAQEAVARAIATPDRAQLIQHAMRVRAAKQAILADLDDEARSKLVAMAMKALLNEGRNKG